MMEITPYQVQALYTFTERMSIRSAMIVRYSFHDTSFNEFRVVYMMRSWIFSSVATRKKPHPGALWPLNTRDQNVLYSAVPAIGQYTDSQGLVPTASASQTPGASFCLSTLMSTTRYMGLLITRLFWRI